MNTLTIYIYIHINKINGKVYIGQTRKEPEKRWHKDGSGYKTQTFFWNAIQKYGWDNFSHSILEETHSQEEANQREIYWISYFNSNNSSFGYNQTAGGRGSELSEEAKQKIRDSWTEERRKIQAQRLHEKWVNDLDYAQKMKEVCKNIPRRDISGQNNPMYGTHRTGKDAARKRKVQCIETGDVFDTIIEAAKWSNEGKITTKVHISAVCKGKRKTSGRHPETGEPLHWKYVDDITEEGVETNES